MELWRGREEESPSRECSSCSGRRARKVGGALNARLSIRYWIRQTVSSGHLPLTFHWKTTRMFTKSYILHRLMGRLK